MYPATFEYHAPRTLDEAVRLLQSNNGDAKVLSGGHSLIPLMKLRLAEPKVIVDIGKIPDLAYIREEGDQIAIGARTTHAQIEKSDLLWSKCPLLADTADQIADVQVRSRGTIGGSLSHADPGADLPAACLVLDAELVIVGPNGERRTTVSDFIVDLLTTTLAPDEIVREIRIKTPPAGHGSSYWKLGNKASHFAIVGVAAVVRSRSSGDVSLGITGLASKAFRATAVENTLRGQALTPESIRSAAAHAADGVEPLSDIHGSAEYRRHLATVITQRAIELALTRGG